MVIFAYFFFSLTLVLSVLRTQLVKTWMFNCLLNSGWIWEKFLLRRSGEALAQVAWGDGEVTIPGNVRETWRLY